MKPSQFQVTPDMIQGSVSVDCHKGFELAMSSLFFTDNIPAINGFLHIKNHMNSGKAHE